MSNSDESGVTYTEVSSPFEGLSDIRSPRADDDEYFELPWMLEDPYVEAALQAPPSPDYMPDPKEPVQAPPSPDYVPGPEHADDEIVAEDQPYAEDVSPTAQSPDYVPESNPEADLEEDDDKDPEEDPVDYPADGGDDGDDEDEPSEEDEDDDVDMEANEDEEEEEYPAPADSVVVALPVIEIGPSARRQSRSRLMSRGHTHHHTLAYRPHSFIRAAMIRLRDEAASTSYSLPLYQHLPFILSPTRSDALLSGIPPPLSISVPTSSPPLLLPSTSRREDIPEVTLPPRKRLGIALGPRYEVGESSSATAARPAGGLRADYGFVATMDREIRHDPERERQTDTCITRTSDKRTEARLSREAWRRSMDASDLAHGEVMSLRTIVLDHRRSVEMRELRKTDRTRQQQLIQTLTVMRSLQMDREQGPAGGLAQPELLEEAGSSS
ncbi:hypothetical protein Tco_1344243 [Tanacetum coccineum]